MDGKRFFSDLCFTGFTCLRILSLVGIATTITALTQARASSYSDDARAVLLENLTPRVRVLNYDTDLFSYQPVTSVRGSRGGAAGPGNFSLQKFYDSFESPQPEALSESQFGPGLYLASDPLVSKDYGQKNWALIVIPYPKGTRVLDARQQNIHFHLLSQKILSLAGCEKSASLAMMLSSTPRCHELAREALAALSVDLIAYDWNVIHSDYCPEMNNEQARLESDPVSSGIFKDAAFVAVSRKPEHLKVKLLTSRIPPNDPDSLERLRVRALIFRELDGREFNLWPELQSHPVPLNLRQWSQTHLFGCDPAHFDYLLKP